MENQYPKCARIEKIGAASPASTHWLVRAGQWYKQGRSADFASGRASVAETFVLVHGGSLGAWSWAAVVAQLQKLGHRAWAVDLPGRGENPHDLATITLALHIDAVARYIEERDLREVVLVGHSMAGLIIPSVAVRLRDRIKRLIFASALVVRDGESAMDVFQPMFEAAAKNASAGRSREDMIERFRRNQLPDASRDLQDFVIAAIVPDQMSVLAEPVPMKEFYALDVPCSVVILEDDRAIDPVRFHPLFTQRLRDPTTRSIQSGHGVMFTKPVEFARALAELAQESQSRE
jgi:pimeloyl-ACP methyl ester carboxylesterase